MTVHREKTSVSAEFYKEWGYLSKSAHGMVMEDMKDREIEKCL